jgi:hypothetical protein
VSQRDGLLLLGRGYDDNNNKKKSLRTYPYGLEGFLAADSAFPLENETMTKCMQWKDQIAYRCPLGLTPPGVINCVCVYRRGREGPSIKEQEILKPFFRS